MMEKPIYTARLPIAVGMSALVMLVGGLGFWSIRTEIAGAVIASGTIVVEYNRQVVQHPEVGVVSRIVARDGDDVAAGDLVLELDDTLLRSDLAVVELQLVELMARRARLEAERDETDRVVFPPELLAADDRAVRDQVEGQRVFFEARRDTFERELGRIAQRTRQTREQIAGTEAQLVALKVLQGLSTDELVVQEDALSRGLTQGIRVSTLRREAAQAAGDIGRLRADVARLRGQIAELEIEGVRLQSARRENAISELRDIQFRRLELTEQRMGLLARLERLKLRAPMAGIIHGSTIFAQNAVVQAAEPLMYIIPQDQPLIVNAEVDAIDIDQVHIGQRAMLRFSAFNQRLTPEVTAEVTGVSADVFENETTGVSYYRVSLAPLVEDLHLLNGEDLVPGMPVEAFIRTEDRTPLSYLTKPLTDYFDRAFRES